MDSEVESSIYLTAYFAIKHQTENVKHMTHENVSNTRRRIYWDRMASIARCEGGVLCHVAVVAAKEGEALRCCDGAGASVFHPLHRRVQR